MIYILYNSVDRFSVGIALLQFGISNTPTYLTEYNQDTQIVFTLEDTVETGNPNIFYFDPAQYGIVIIPGQDYITLTDEVIQSILENIAADANQDSDNFDTIREILDRIQRNNYRLPFIDNRNRNSGFPSQIRPNFPGSGLGGLGFVDQPPPGGGGMSGGMGIGQIVQVVSGFLFHEDGDKCSSRAKRQKTCSNINGVTITTLESFGYVFNRPIHVIVEDGIRYNLYEVNFETPEADAAIDLNLRDRIEYEYRKVGDNNPEFAIFPRTDNEEGTYKLYYLTRVNDSNEIIVSRSMISYHEPGHIVKLDEFVACKVGKGYGTLLMKSLAQYSCTNPDSDIQITNFVPGEGGDDGLFKAYKDLFKLSVTRFKSVCDSNDYTIFKPTDYLITEIYQIEEDETPFNLEILTQSQRDKYKAFIMNYHDELLRYFLQIKSISLEEIKEILIDKYELNKENRILFNSLLFDLSVSNPLRIAIRNNINNPIQLYNIFTNHFNTL